MGQDISVTVGDYLFNYRVGAVIRRKNTLLVCRSARDNFCYWSGGRVKGGESTPEALVRELQEELNLTVRVKRPLFFAETFLARTSSVSMSFVCTMKLLYLTRSCFYGLPMMTMNCCG